MNQKLKLTLILGGIFLFLGLSFFFATRLEKIPANPEGTVGNTAGNLYNNGLFCETSDKIYFSNAYDNGALYSMNRDGSDIKKLHEGNSQFLNVGGDYLYYYQGKSKSGGAGLGYLRGVTGLYRITKDGRKVTGLSREAVGCVKLIDNTLFYLHNTKEDGTTLHRINTNKQEDEVVINQSISPAASYNGKIYYGGEQKDHNLYSIDLKTYSSAIELNANLCYPIVENGYLYYMDIENNYRLCRIDLANIETGAQVLTNDRIDLYNVYDNVIFYQRNSQTEPALIRMNIDGSNPEVVAEGNHSNINCTGDYTYFTTFGEEVPIYRTSTYGNIYVETFDAARDAALQELE